MLKIGDTAPDFEQADQSGATLSLEQLLSTGDLILYFYPADFTPVCTAETCAFRDNFDGLAAVGAQIVGVSPQGTDSHARFSDRYSIPFPLLSDPRKEIIRAYGVDGPLGFGVRRVTYLIDRSKTIKNRVVSDFFVGSHTDLLKKTIRDRSESS